MSIYAIGDLHLSFSTNKPMDIFGENWRNHEEKIKQDWLLKVKDDDTVILAGDFSWGMNMEEALADFEYINKFPGKKILLKGNHDYWWTTITSMKKFLSEHNIEKIDFLHNNSFEVENKIICGTRGWNISDALNIEDTKIINREISRLKLSIESGIKQFGNNKEKIAFLHYPPITLSNILKNETTPFIQVLNEFKIKNCYYGHLHGLAIKEAVNGNIDEISLHLISADGVDFKLQKI